MTDLDRVSDSVDTSGSSATLDTLVENHRAFLRFLERRVGSRDTAEDLLQEAFGRAVTHAQTLREDESAVAWFYRLLRNAVIDHYRRNAAAGSALERFASELPEAMPPPEVAGQICACVSHLAGTLKPEYAEALREIDVRGVPVKDYAATHGLRQTTRASGYFVRARHCGRRWWRPAAPAPTTDAPIVRVGGLGSDLCRRADVANQRRVDCLTVPCSCATATAPPRFPAACSYRT